MNKQEAEAMQRRTELLIAQEGKCFYCNRPMDSIAYPQSQRGFTVDHFYPKSKGNGLAKNKVYAHHHCNRKKDSRNPNKRELEKFNNLRKKIKKRRSKIFN